MSDDRDLEQELRDERARRKEAERRLEDFAERAELWRQRAEERSERIERLLEAQSRPSNKARKWVKGLLGDPPTSHQAEEESSPRLPDRYPAPRLPSLRSWMVVSSVADPGKASTLSAFDNHALEDSQSEDLDRADLVVLDPISLSSLDDNSKRRLENWANQTARQPLLIWASGSGLGRGQALLRQGDLVASSEAAEAKRLEVQHIAGCFDPTRHSPLTGPPQLAIGDRPHADLDIVEAAAIGTPFDDSPGGATAAIRWAYRNHAPWVRASKILDLAGIKHRDPIPTIAAVLISHRPESVPNIIEAVARQTHRQIEFVIGLHGARATPPIEESAERLPFPSRILSFGSELSLGECLNVAIASTRAPLIAKIDDDDIYGRAHLEDSFHALAYSGADIVGKGSHYTYVAGVDKTVLRRPGQEQMFIDGSPNGATLVFRREVWDEAGFPHRPRHVDTGFLRAARSLQRTVYAGSRWEFCYVRRPQGHTWDAEDEVFLAGAQPAWDGLRPDWVEVPDVDGR